MFDTNITRNTIYNVKDSRTIQVKLSRAEDRIKIETGEFYAFIYTNCQNWGGLKQGEALKMRDLPQSREGAYTRGGL